MDFINDILQYHYLSNAVIACALSGIICGIVGTYIVARRMVFLCGGITHASFGGLGIAFYAGLNPIGGAMLFAILSALGIERLSYNSRIREDSAIGMVWGVGMAIGALFMSLRPGYTSGEMSNYLFGNIITVTDNDIIALAVLTTIILVGATLWHRQIMFVAFDRDFAEAAGINTKAVGYIMATISAVAIVLSIRIMGIVLLISLLTMPVVIANMLTKHYPRIALWAALTATTAALLGITASYYLEVPSGPAIIFSLTLFLLIIKIVYLCVKRVELRKRA
ncbi:MAG: metal ABC transporter permease [Alistipes sp.]|nr:metal ABC transporter permease [Alistipes sp.]